MSAEPAEPLLNTVQVKAQRSAVLRAVSSRSHITADAVAEAARAEIGAISRQAVYDALGVLADKGILRRIQPARSPARYEDRVGDTTSTWSAVPAAVWSTPTAQSATPPASSPPTTRASRSTKQRSSTRVSDPVCLISTPVSATG